MPPHATSFPLSGAPAASPARPPAAGLAAWGPPDKAVVLDFAAGRFRLGTAGFAPFAAVPGLSVARSSGAWGLTPGGLPVAAVADQPLVVPGRGLLHAPAAERLNALDLSQAAASGGAMVTAQQTVLPDGRTGTAWRIQLPEGPGDPAIELAGSHGSEINPNPDFSDWTGGIPDGFSGINLGPENTVTQVPEGVRILTDAAGTFAGLFSTFVVEAGRTYTLECDIAAISGTLRIDLSDATGTTTFNAPGSYSIPFAGGATDRFLRVVRHVPDLDATISRLSLRPVRSGPHTAQLWLRAASPHAPASLSLGAFASPQPVVAEAAWAHRSVVQTAAGMPARIARAGTAAADVLAVWPDVQAGAAASPILAPGVAASRAEASIAIAGLDAIAGIAADHVFTATFEDGATAPLAAAGGTLTIPSSPLAYRSIAG